MSHEVRILLQRAPPPPPAPSQHARSDSVQPSPSLANLLGDIRKGAHLKKVDPNEIHLKELDDQQVLSSPSSHSPCPVSCLFGFRLERLRTYCERRWMCVAKISL